MAQTITTAGKNLILTSGLPNSVLIALFNGDPTASGVEVAGGGYSRKTVAMAAAAVGARQLNAVVDFGFATSGTWSQATHAAIYTTDASVLIAVIPLTNGPFVTTPTSKLTLPATSAQFQIRLTDPA